jgi:DNA-binding HxlR family transcriptional regulator
MDTKGPSAAPTWVSIPGSISACEMQAVENISDVLVNCKHMPEEDATPPPMRSGCPVNAAVETFGDRWTLLVLRDVMFGNRRHFRELQAGSEEGIASNILADRLQRLVRDGLLTRTSEGRGHKVTYSLTEAAIQLVPVFAHLGAWGLRHRHTAPELRERAEQLETGGPKLWNTYMNDLRAIHLTAAKHNLGVRESVQTPRLAYCEPWVGNRWVSGSSGRGPRG